MDFYETNNKYLKITLAIKETKKLALPTTQGYKLAINSSNELSQFNNKIKSLLFF